MQPNDPRLRKWVERIDLFHGLTTDDVYKIYNKGMTLSIAKGEAAFHKGTTGNSMYVVMSGSFGVFDGPKQIATKKVGDTFGEMSLLTGATRSASLVALSDTRVFMLDEEIFKKLLTKKVAVQILLNIGRLLSKSLEDSNMTIRELEGR